MQTMQIILTLCLFCPDWIDDFAYKMLQSASSMVMVYIGEWLVWLMQDIKDPALNPTIHFRYICMQWFENKNYRKEAGRRPQLSKVLQAESLATI